MTVVAPVCRASNADLARFFAVGDDTRRRVLAELGLPKRRAHRWTEVWHALGLSAEQPAILLPELTLGPDRSNILLTPARVAQHLHVATDTVNRWRRGDAPSGFPAPLLDLGPRLCRWLPLDVRAFDAPALYGDLASQVVRRARKPRRTAPDARLPAEGSLEPLPPQSQPAP